jgi:hypothetical protein
MKKNQKTELSMKRGIVDMMLLDHKEVKKFCQKILENQTDKKEILKISKIFLQRILNQMMAEEKALYKNLALEKKFKLLAYEAVSEHHFLKNQIKKMLKKINSLRTLGEQDQIDLRVISKFYLNHLFFEEKDLLPEIQNEFEKSELMTWGERYFSLRKDEFSKMGPFPVLEEELISWKDSIQKLSSQLLLQMDQQVSQLKH